MAVAYRIHDGNSTFIEGALQQRRRHVQQEVGLRHLTCRDVETRCHVPSWAPNHARDEVGSLVDSRDEAKLAYLTTPVVQPA